MADSQSNVSPLPASKGGTAVPSTAPPDHGPLGPKDNAQVREAIYDAVREIVAIEAERKACNDRISAVKEGIKSRNINMKAFAAALAYFKMPDAHRVNFDTDLAISRKAVDMPIQPALFDDDEPAPKASH